MLLAKMLAACLVLLIVVHHGYGMSLWNRNLFHELKNFNLMEGEAWPAMGMLQREYEPIKKSLSPVGKALTPTSFRLRKRGEMGRVPSVFRLKKSEGAALPDEHWSVLRDALQLLQIPSPNRKY